MHHRVPSSGSGSGEQPPEPPEPGEAAVQPAEGGPPAEHLREFLRERFGDVPPESPTEPDRSAEREGDAGTQDDEQQEEEGEPELPPAEHAGDEQEPEEPEEP